MAAHELAAEAGRTVLGAYSEATTDSDPSAAHGFATHHGFEVVQTELRSDLVLPVPEGRLDCARGRGMPPRHGVRDPLVRGRYPRRMAVRTSRAGAVDERRRPARRTGLSGRAVGRSPGPSQPRTRPGPEAAHLRIDRPAPGDRGARRLHHPARTGAHASTGHFSGTPWSATITAAIAWGWRSRSPTSAHCAPSFPPSSASAHGTRRRTNRCCGSTGTSGSRSSDRTRSGRSGWPEHRPGRCLEHHPQV